ncbi:MAG: iron-containing alcohol dehydrogenase [Alphaproteobacteria bacterium]|nr:iron-containing alcohol dehydrogenase [Alphaproteobacteria bacterium]
MTLVCYRALPRERVYPDTPALEAVLAERDLAGGSRVLILSSATLAQPDGPVRKLEASLGEACAGVGTMLSEHTPLAAVLDARRLIEETSAELIVAIGGGSVIDGSKAVKAAIAANLYTFEDFARHSLATASPMPLPEGGPILMAIPTTLSAAEFTATAGYTNPLSGLKEGLRAPHLAPLSVALDPDLALATPLPLWTSSGMRAIDHAVETIFSPRVWPALQRQAATGLNMLARALRAAVDRPDDRFARRDGQQAVWLISDGPAQLTMGASHGLGYLLGTLGGVPHGLTSCVLLPETIRWNTQTCPQPAALVAEALGEKSAHDGIVSLLEDLGLPHRIGTLNVDKAILDSIAKHALTHPVVLANPRPFADREAVRALLERAW